MDLISARLIRTGILVVAGGLCWLGASVAVDYVENTSLRAVQSALTSAGQDWTEIGADGLQILLAGTAPSEAARFRALTTVDDVVSPKRIVDEINVEEPIVNEGPEFSIEILRSNDGISLIGMIPSSTDRRAVTGRLRQETAAGEVTDLLESADFPAPRKWDVAIDFGIHAVQLASHAKISITPGNVDISAVATSSAEKDRLLDELKSALPAGLEMTTNISAPRPVVTPFTLSFSIIDGKEALETCAADNEAGQSRIVAAATKAGVSGTPDCVLAIGAPSPNWADAAVAVIEAVAKLGSGTVAISDADIFLYAPAEIERSDFDETVVALKAALPPVFSLQAELERLPDQLNAPAEFNATLDADRALTMRGVIGDQQMHDAIDSFAQARFAAVTDDLTNDKSVPEGWTVKVIAGIESMEMLDNGWLKITPDVIEISGTSGNEQVTEQIVSSLSQRIGPGAAYHVSVRYDRRLDPQIALPNGDDCVNRLNVIMSEAAIGFEPGSAKIAGDPTETLKRLAAVMADCSDFQLEAGGHTDSQGSEGLNTDLSRGRAQALVQAMTEAGIDTTNLTSRGYGESQPIATNDTEEGREENRRIEFSLLSESPIVTQPLPAPVTAIGVTTVHAPPDAKDVTDNSVSAPAEGELVDPVSIPEAIPEKANEPANLQPLDQVTPTLPQEQSAPVADDTPDESEAATDESL